MRITLTALVVVLALGSAVAARAESTKVVEARTMEAVVTVTKVDAAAGTVTVQGPNGNHTVLAVPANAQNLDKVREGTRFKVRFLEETVVSLSSAEAASSAGQGRVVQLAPKGGNPAGTLARTLDMNGQVESADPANLQITLRTTQGESRTMRVAPDVKLIDVKPGDRITVSYTQALATFMASTPQPVSDPAPAQ
jgi:hypothetical protein